VELTTEIQSNTKQKETEQISYIEVVSSKGKHYRRKFNEKKRKKTLTC